MNDMSSVIVPKSDQINADDLIGREMTITIRDVQIKGGQEQPVSIYFDGSDKAFRPCKGMSRVLVAAWGADAKNYIGRSLTLYRDPKVKWGGLEVGGIRIKAMSHIDKPMTMAIAESRAVRKPVTVQPLTNVPQSNAGSDDLGAWAHKFIASVANVASAEKLDAGVAQVQSKIAALADAIPEAHAAVMQAIEARRATFAPADDDPFADPPTDDAGPSVSPADLEGRIAAAETDDQLDEIGEDLIKLADSLPGGDVLRLDGLIAARRRALGKGR
jgi:hypothetical protein